MKIARTRRRKSPLPGPRLLSLLGAVLLALVLSSMPSPASAHGVAMVPGSRTYLCYQDLVAHSSTQMPANPACADAVRATGTTPLYNWFAILESNGGGRSEDRDDGMAAAAARGGMVTNTRPPMRSPSPTTAGTKVPLPHSRGPQA